jgi:hypothetical protein
LTQRVRLDLAMADIISLETKHLTDDMKEPFAQFHRMLRKGIALTPAQHNYLEGMYERFMEKKFKFGKVSLHMDLKARSRKSLRF